MKKNFLRNCLIGANVFMFLVCYFSWSSKSTNLNLDLTVEEDNVENFKEIRARALKNAGENGPKKPRKLMRTRVFPRGGDNLKFDQPWTIPVTKILDSFDDLDKDQRYIVGNFSYSPGLGNLMFQYAALRALAEEFGANVVLPSTCLLRRAFGNFDSRVILMQPSAVKDFLVSNSKKTIDLPVCCKFYPGLELFKDGEKVQILTGYFQSFKYFHEKRSDLIRKQFKFLPEVTGEAVRFLDEAKYKNWNKELNLEDDDGNDKVVQLPDDFDDYFYVGVHVRRGMDLTMNSRNLKHGHVAAPPSFYKKAMEYFIDKFSWKKVVFVVASDDVEWTKKNFKSSSPINLIFLEGRQREVDMASLALCHASILSTGTFSWWSAYLANGPVVYFEDWPRPGSELEGMVVKPDYFLPSWIPMK